MKTFLKTLACSVTMLFAVSCSNDNNDAAVAFNQKNLDAAADATAVSVWDGEIGALRNGIYVITADEAQLMAELQDTLNKKGNKELLETLEILEKHDVNNPSDTAYMLIASNSKGTSIGVLLKAAGSSQSLQLDNDLGFKATSCTGCVSGCNLSYLKIDGKNVPYCNENGCIYDCTQG